MGNEGVVALHGTTVVSMLHSLTVM